MSPSPATFMNMLPCSRHRDIWVELAKPIDALRAKASYLFEVSVAHLGGLLVREGNYHERIFKAPINVFHGRELYMKSVDFLGPIT